MEGEQGMLVAQYHVPCPRQEEGPVGEDIQIRVGKDNRRIHGGLRCRGWLKQSDILKAFEVLISNRSFSGPTRNRLTGAGGFLITEHQE